MGRWRGRLLSTIKLERFQVETRSAISLTLGVGFLESFPRFDVRAGGAIASSGSASRSEAVQ